MVEKYAIPFWAINYILFGDEAGLSKVQKNEADTWLDMTFGVFRRNVKAEPDKDGNDISYYSKAGGAFGGPRQQVVDMNFIW